MNHCESLIGVGRVDRLHQAIGDFRVCANESLLAAADLCGRPWIGVTCSRLGKDNRLHAQVCRFLSRCLLDCRHRQAVAVVAAGSAAEPWTVRAAALFGVDLILLAVAARSRNDSAPTLVIESTSGQSLSRDLALIAISDRVDALYVRPGGNACQSLSWRLQTLRDATTRVAVIDTKKSAARKLIDAGAVGWFLATTESQQPTTTGAVEQAALAVDPNWIRHDGEWLVHCTRTCSGPWPGQTQHQYQDELLLSDSPPRKRTPLDSLRRILRSGRLVRNAHASAKAWPVVCFSETPLRELLDRRCFRPHLNRWDYEPYGIAIRKRVALEMGVQPVIYGTPEQRSQFGAADQFRFQAVGTTFDWTQEREWRAASDIDLLRCSRHDVRVFVPSVDEAAALARFSNWSVDVVSVTTGTPSVAK